MRRFLQRSVGLAIVALATTTSAHASQSDLLALPSDTKFGCTSCHAGAGTTATEVPAGTEQSLTQFGQDWLNFGSIWGPEIARENSDGDGCSNGYEMGDPTGSWQVGDDRIAVDPQDQRNPGDAADCALPIDDKSWGTLKSLFGS